MATNLSQSIFKKAKKDDKYAQISNELINNRDISYKALGIMTYILSKPDDWQVYVSDLIRDGRDAEKSIRSGIKELIENKYMQRYMVYDIETGKVHHWETLVSEEKFEENTLISHVKEKYLKDSDGKIVMKKITLNKSTRYIPIVLEREEFLLCQKGEVEENQSTSTVELLSQKVQVEKLKVEKEGQQILINTNTDFSSSSNNSHEPNIYEEFEESICELKKTTLIKFNKVVELYSDDFIRAVLEQCVYAGRNSYNGFEIILNSYIDRNCKTGEDVKKATLKFRANRAKEIEAKRTYTKKQGDAKKSNFNNYEQRRYDFDKLEDKLRGIDKTGDLSDCIIDQ